MAEDMRCTWCHKIVAVCDARGEYLPLRPFIDEGKKHYCVEPCYRQLRALVAFVADRKGVEVD